MAKSARAHEEIIETFTCIICLEAPTEPYLCPKCSKIFCLECIRDWLYNASPGQHICPHCQEQITLSSLVKLRWFDALNESLQNLSDNSGVNSGEELCALHLKPFRFTCFECQVSLCEKCLSEDDTHEDHQFQKINLYKKAMEKLEIEFKRVIGYVDEMKLTASSIGSNIAAITAEKVQLVNNIKTIVEDEQRNLDGQLADKTLHLHQKKQMLTKDIEATEISLSELQSEVAAIAKTNLSENSQRIINKCAELTERPLSTFQPEPITNVKFESSLIPDYKSGVIFLSEGTLNASQLFYDDMGFCWKLELCGVIRITLESGAHGIFEYRIEIPHTDPAKTFRIAGAHDFKLAPSVMHNFECDVDFTPRKIIKLIFSIRPQNLVSKFKCLQAAVDKFQYQNEGNFDTSMLISAKFVRNQNLVFNKHLVHCTGSTFVLALVLHDFLSVEIRMINGSAGVYNFFVELIHSGDVAKNKKLESTKYFDKQGKHGKHGFDNIISLNEIRAESYVHAANYLKIQFGVRIKPTIFNSQEYFQTMDRCITPEFFKMIFMMNPKGHPLHLSWDSEPEVDDIGISWGLQICYKGAVVFVYIRLLDGLDEGRFQYEIEMLNIINSSRRPKLKSDHYFVAGQPGWGESMINLDELRQFQNSNGEITFRVSIRPLDIFLKSRYQAQAIKRLKCFWPKVR